MASVMNSTLKVIVNKKCNFQVDSCYCKVNVIKGKNKLLDTI